MNKRIIINNEAVDIDYEEADFREYLGNVSYVTSFLVRYNRKTDQVFVDKSAPEWYKPLAALHEMICCGHHYEYLVPDLKYAKTSYRCAAVEDFIVNHAGSHKQAYIEERLRMFRTILSNDLCASKMRASIVNTVNYLKHQL